MHWWWLLLVPPMIVGLTRLHFDAELLNLLPSDVAAVKGLKLYQQHFANARELIITVRTPSSETAEAIAGSIGVKLRRATNLVTDVTWQPPWLEHPEQTAELIAHLWLNQPPEIFAQLGQRLAQTNLASVLASAREQLATTLSPTDLAQLSYDPFGLTRLPENVTSAAPRFGQGQEIFASNDGKFRIIFVKAHGDLKGYRECTQWFESAKRLVNDVLSESGVRGVSIGYTGRPAFVAEISGSMRRDIILSVGGTAIIIAALFWLAHRRWKPMLWLLALLALILAGTLALGGLLFGTINVVSMGFAAILLGLAVDYAVVHYQEALAHPDLSVPEIRRAIAPSIFWAAFTTIAAFLVLNFGGLPGLAQLGSLVGVGVALSAVVMIFAFLPPLFPDRRRLTPKKSISADAAEKCEPISFRQIQVLFALTAGLLSFCVGTLFFGFPGMDATANVLQPRDSQAYVTLDAIKEHLNQKREPLWLIIAGQDESDIARKLDAATPVLSNAVSNQLLAGFTLPTALWPRPDFQSANRPVANGFVAERAALQASALSSGFTEEALGLTESILDSWKRAGDTAGVFWPTNQLCSWIFEKLVARGSSNLYAAGFLYAATNSLVGDVAAFENLSSQLHHQGVWLSGWELLGSSMLAVVEKNLWKLLLPMVGLVLLSVWLAFRRIAEIFLSLSILVMSGLVLLATMKTVGWSWNLLNLMALPLILGTGVDYSIFMQLALRRHHGNLRAAHRSVGRALLLCGGTAVGGFGSLAMSSNAGMASLGQVCAVGIASNMLISVFLLPVWWRSLRLGSQVTHGVNGRIPAQHPLENSYFNISQPSATYRVSIWRIGLVAIRVLPEVVVRWMCIVAAVFYRLVRPRRFYIVAENLLPVFQEDRNAAECCARSLFREFAFKIADLWRFESGLPVDRWLANWSGWKILSSAHARSKGVLIVTPHLGNWEFGGSFLAKRGFKLLVLTQSEPGRGFTELRQNARARWGIETLVVGEDAFAFVEIIKRLQEGAMVALLIDRPPAPTAVTVELFGRPFQASIAAAELARASGCAVVPVYVVRESDGYAAHILQEIIYDRAAIGDRAGRIELTQEILRAFEPVIRQHADQWYHFVPIWQEIEPEKHRS